MIEGTLIAESLRTGTNLENLKLTVRKISRFHAQGTSGDQPGIWTTLDFEADEAQAEDLARVTLAVRAAGSYNPSDYGAPLMDKAFHPDTGPMGDRDTSKTKSEREGLLTLFKGAMNAYPFLFTDGLGHCTTECEIIGKPVF